MRESLEHELTRTSSAPRILARGSNCRKLIPPGGVEVYKADRFKNDDYDFGSNNYNLNQKEDWFQAIRKNRKPTMDIAKAHQAAVLCILGNLSFVLGRKLHWDGEKQEFIGDPVANRMLSKPQRHPYHL